MAKTNKKKQAMEDAPKEAEAKKKAEDVLPVGSAVVEDDAADDDELAEEAEDGEPVAPGPEGKPALLPDARSTTTPAKRSEDEIRADWLALVGNAARAQADVDRWAEIVADPLMQEHLTNLRDEVEDMKEEMTKADGSKALLKLQAEVTARRWVVAKFSPVLFDADRNAAASALEKFRAEPWHRGLVQKWEAELGWDQVKPEPSEVEHETKLLASITKANAPPQTDAEKVAALEKVAAKGEKTKAELASASA